MQSLKYIAHCRILFRLTIGYINFLAEIVSKDKNPDEAGSRQAAAPQQKKVVVHSAKGKRRQEGLI